MQLVALDLAFNSGKNEGWETSTRVENEGFTPEALAAFRVSSNDNRTCFPASESERPPHF